MTLCKQKPENPDRKCLHFPKTLRLRKITGYIGKLTFAYVNLVFCLPKQISIEQCLEFKLVKSGIRLIPRSGELSWRRTEQDCQIINRVFRLDYEEKTQKDSEISERVIAKKPVVAQQFHANLTSISSTNQRQPYWHTPTNVPQTKAAYCQNFKVKRANFFSENQSIFQKLCSLDG